MQVGVKSGITSTINSSSLSRGRVSSSQSVTHAQRAQERVRTEFPESPLLSTQPMRYNIQLNKQLTSVQQADSYLGQVENKLLRLRHAVGAASPKDNDVASIKQRAEELSTLLKRRQTLSAGTVDRQLNAVLDGQAKVNFTLRSAETLFQHSESETLIFSLAGKQRDIVAVQLSEEGSAEQIVRTLNLGLGKFSVHGRLDEHQRPVFSADERMWPRLSEHLSVRGEGHRYPEGQFFPVRLIAEPTLEDSLSALIDKPGQARKKMPEVQKTLEQVTAQRRQLLQHKESVQQRIDGMAGFPAPGSAVEASQLLRASLSGAGHSYPSLMEVTSGQANLHINTVKNLLA